MFVEESSGELEEEHVKSFINKGGDPLGRGDDSEDN